MTWALSRPVGPWNKVGRAEDRVSSDEARPVGYIIFISFALLCCSILAPCHSGGKDMTASTRVIKEKALCKFVISAPFVVIDHAIAP